VRWSGRCQRGNSWVLWALKPLQKVRVQLRLAETGASFDAVGRRFVAARIRDIVGIDFEEGEMAVFRPSRLVERIVAL